MARTFNKAPYTFNTPSNSDVKTYSFLQSNWKGVNTDKNFIEVDQETFADAKNVYVDSQGLLRSRPASKITHILVNGSELSNIIDVFTFDDVIVYKSEMAGKYYLTFVNGDNVVQHECDERIKLVLADKKIFVFSPTSLHAYDVNSKLYEIASNVYIPVTKVYKGSQYEELEPENELTTSYITRYLFDNVTDMVYDTLIGKLVKITMLGKEYEFVFKKDNQLVFLEEVTPLTENNTIIYHGRSYTLVSVSEKDTFIICSTDIREYSVYDRGTMSYDIFYTVDGLTFTQLPRVENVIGVPKISKDGFHVYCVKEDDLYVLSVVDVENEEDYYSNWTPLLTTKYGIDDVPWYYGDTVCEMDSIDNFVIYYITPSKKDGFTMLYRYLCICLNGNLAGPYNDVAYCISSYEKTSEFPIGGYELNPDDATTNGDWNLSDKTYDNSVYSCSITDINVVKNTNYYTVNCTITRTVKATNATIQKTISCNCTSNEAYKIDDVGVNIANIEGVDYLLIGPLGKTFYFDIYSIQSPTLYDAELPTTRYLNIYDFVPNIKCTFRNNRATVLVDTGNIQLVSYDGISLGIMPLATEYINPTKNTLWDGLYLSDDVMYTKFYSDTITEELRLYKGLTNEYEVVAKSDYKSIFDKNGNLITGWFIKTDTERIPTFTYTHPIAYENHLYSSTMDMLYTNNFKNLVSVDFVTKGHNKYILPDFVTELDNFYFSKDNTLYISKSPTKAFQWYFPKVNTQECDYKITNLHPISQNEVAIFTENNVYYVKKEIVSNDTGRSTLYYHYKSKIQVGCKYGGDIITTYDGNYTIFASKRGIVAMTYQQFVATTEQSVAYLTDAICDKYEKFYTQSVKIFKYGFWIVFYKDGHNDALVFDTRNNSWWFTSGPYVIHKIAEIDNNVKLLLNNNIFEPYVNDEEYYDYNGTATKIDWFIDSQKLHLNSVDYQKNIRDVTIVSVLDNDKPMSFKIQLTNYRKTIGEGTEQLLEYDVDSIRTFVKHLNCMKVNQIKYRLSNNEESYIQLPLSISSIGIKYKITRQVR